LAVSLPKHAWRTVTWREGTNEKLQSRFARVRVHAAPLRGEARRALRVFLDLLHDVIAVPLPAMECQEDRQDRRRERVGLDLLIRPMIYPYRI
jgi:hypothetical protein